MFTPCLSNLGKSIYFWSMAKGITKGANLYGIPYPHGNEKWILGQPFPFFIYMHCMIFKNSIKCWYDRGVD